LSKALKKELGDRAKLRL